VYTYISIIFNIWLRIICVFRDGACSLVLLSVSLELLKMIVGILTTCHTQYTSDSSICIFLFTRTTLQVSVTYLTGAPYVHPLWFYKHQHDNRVRSTQNTFSLSFAAILVNCAPSGEMHNYCTPHIIKENFENFLIYRCKYILLSQVYCVWQVVKTPTIILNNPVVNLQTAVLSITEQSPLSRECFMFLVWANCRTVLIAVAIVYVRRHFLRFVLLN